LQIFSPARALQTVMRTLVLGLMCLAAVPATAQKRARPPAPPPVQRLDFGDGDTVEADVNLPSGEQVMVRTGSKHPSLIRLRTTFVPEMVRDANRL
jgi:hypothetical protein